MVAPGWYPDPWTPTRLRWWSGADWTEHQWPPVEPAPRRRSWHWKVVAVALCLLIVTGSLGAALLVRASHDTVGHVPTQIEPSSINADQDSVVTVIATSQGSVASGSGFFVSNDGRLLTNAHVIENARNLRVQLRGGERLVASVVATDNAHDVAELQVSYRSQPLKLASQAAQVGDVIYVLGNPLGTSPNTTVRGSVVGLHLTAYVEGRHYTDLIETDATVYPGNSGGPGVDEQGQVLGMVTLGDQHGGIDSGGDGYLLADGLLETDINAWAHVSPVSQGRG